MASNITKEDREFFEQYLKKHPPVEPSDPDLIDDHRMDYDHDASAAWLVKLLLDGKIE